MTKSDFSHTSRNAGFTIIEILIATAIMLLIMLCVTRFWVATSEAFTLDGNIVLLKKQSERAMDTMTAGLLRANKASLTLSNGNRTIDFTDTFDSSQVRYELRPLAPAAPIWGQIVQTVNGTESVVTGYVQDVQFIVSPSTDIVTIDATFHAGAGRTETTLNSVSCVSSRSMF
jgi:prepilin-type N-terminal cleavage/methylation domain-containing protein